MIKITIDEARCIIYGDHEDYDPVETRIIDQSSWSIGYEHIVEHIPTGKFYRFYLRHPATERQEWEEDDVNLVEVYQVEKIIKVWKPVK